MDATSAQPSQPQPAAADMFVPKMLTVLREGYSLDAFRADAVAGLTVAIVALPLSMAIAIASGTTPDRGLYAAIFGGFLVSLLGGSRFQIGGPAGAFIVLVAASMARHGIEGVLLATMMAGVFLVVAGVLRIGSYIRYIPHPVTVGFTAGIAVIIFASQIRDLLGITLSGKEPGELIPKLEALGRAIGTTNAAAVAISLVTIVIIVGLRKLRPTWPGMLIAVAITSAAAALLSFPVETIGTRFGGIPQSFPMPSFPAITLAKLEAVLPDAIMFAILGAIESLPLTLPADTRAVVLDLRGVISMDTSGLDAVQQLHRVLKRRDATLVLAGADDEAMALIRGAGFDSVIGARHLVPDVDAALALLNTRSDGPGAEAAAG